MQAEDIVNLRVRLGLTRAQFSRLLQVSRLTVTRWETNLSTPAGTSMAVMEGFDTFLRIHSTEEAAEAVKLVRHTAACGGVCQLLFTMLEEYREQRWLAQAGQTPEGCSEAQPQSR